MRSRCRPSSGWARPSADAGALLVQEAARRTGRGWPTMVLLAAAYALVEEALVDAMVFNPGYLGLDSFAAHLEIPGIRTSLLVTLWSLALHTVWSIGVPIALVEAFAPDPREPWLGRTGTAVTAAVFVAGCAFLAVVQAQEFDFVPSPVQYAVASAAVVVLVVAAFRVRARATPLGGDAPRPVTAGLAAFAVTSAYLLCSELPYGGSVVVFAAAAVLSWTVVRHCSRQDGWGGRHRVALAAGAAATYGTWFGPLQSVAGPVETALGVVVLGAAVLGIVVLAFRRQPTVVPSSPPTT